MPAVGFDGSQAVTRSREGGAAAGSLRPLLRNQTLDRALVHRHGVSEVFVTDHQPVGPHGYEVAVQLPRSHSYYGDHRRPRAAPDPLLLLESARQAETLGSHEYFAIPHDIKFVLSSWRLSVSPVPEGVLGAGPVPLTISVKTSNQRLRLGILQRQEYAMTIASGDHVVGEVWMDVAYLGPALYRKMRTSVRGRTPQLSNPGQHQPGSPLQPYRIARRDPANVLLQDVVTVPGRYAATLRVPVANPSMFDHPLDHVPGMVLTEAARQLALLSGFDGTAQVTAARLTDIRAQFERHTELDSVCELRAHHREHPGRPVMPGEVQVEVWQDNRVTARFAVTHSAGGDT